MGGRGSFSSSHGGIKVSSGGASNFYVSQKQETRKDIRTLFIDELGFKDVYGTSNIPTAQLAALGIQLKKSESKLKTLQKNEVYLAAINKPGVKGAAAQMGDGSFAIFINPSEHTSVGGYRKTLRSEQASGYKTKTNNKITNDFSYTARHEYGHLTQYSITKNTGKSASQIRNEVQNISRTKYNGKRSTPSTYGSKNDREYFAESFASMTGGNPNSHGMALSDWLKNRKLVK